MKVKILSVDSYQATPDVSYDPINSQVGKAITKICVVRVFGVTSDGNYCPV